MTMYAFRRLLMLVPVLLGVVREDYVRTARAKGLNEAVVTRAVAL